MTLATIRDRIRLSVEQTGSLRAFAAEMVRDAQAACTAQPPDRVWELRATLAAVTALEIAADIPPEAIGVLALAGHHDRANDLAAMVALEARSDAYYRIAIALKNSGRREAADAAAADAIGAAGSYARDSGVDYHLGHLAFAFREDGMPEWAGKAQAVLRDAGTPGPLDEYQGVRILADEGDIDSAWEAARRITEPDTRNRAVGDIVVGALSRAGRFQDAMRAASTVEHRYVELIADIAGIAAERGDADTAMEIVAALPAEQRTWAARKAANAWARAGRADDAITLTELIDDVRGREHGIREVASVLAQTGHIDDAISVWTATPSTDLRDHFTADLAKAAAGTGDIDGALQFAAVIDEEYPRRTAVVHAASAAALGGDLRRTTALVRVIGNASGEDDAFAAVAKNLAAAGRFDDADTAAGLIAGTSKQAEALVTVADALAATGDYRRSASTAERAVQAAGENFGALIAWARALTFSGRPHQAVIVAERAVRAAEQAEHLDRLTQALATWSAALAVCGRQAEALTAAERSIAAVDSPDENWHSDPQYWRDRRAQDVAAILAEAGLAEQAIMLGQSLAQEYDRDQEMTVVAERLAQRGLADQAIEALRSSSHFASYRARDDLGKIARTLARYGHGDGAVRAACALGEVDGLSGLVEYDIARLVTDVARTLAENGHVEAALLAAAKNRAWWGRPAAYAEVACAVALAGDTGRALEIAETYAGPAAVAKVASALAESGRTELALPLAERAITAVLTGVPGRPGPMDAVAQLEDLALPSASGQPADPRQGGSAGSAVSDAAVAAALQAVSEANAIADPAGRTAAQAQAAVRLALTKEPAQVAQAVALARAAVEHAREAGDLGDMTTPLGNAAMAFNLAGDVVMAGEAAAECLAAAAASPFPDDSMAAALAVYVLTDIGPLADALAGLGSLNGEAGKGAMLCRVAERLILGGRAGELSALVSDQNGLPSISGPNERVGALTALGRLFARTGVPALAETASVMAEEAGALAGELGSAHEKAFAFAGQAELLVALGRNPEAADCARRALEAAAKPIRGWRGQVVTKAVTALVQCGQIEDAAEAMASAPPDQRAECVVTVASALFDAGEKDRATRIVSEEIGSVRARGLRQAFYDLVCAHLPKHPGLLNAWIGDDTEMAEIGRELAAIERGWM